MVISFTPDEENEGIGDNVFKWPAWKIELIHEMVHEYQFKIMPEVSEVGLKLYNRFQESPEVHRQGQRGFDGGGHSEVFYTRVSLFARYFNMTGEDLIVHPVRHI